MIECRFFFVCSRNFHSYMDVSIPGDGPQYWGLKINITELPITLLKSPITLQRQLCNDQAKGSRYFAGILPIRRKTKDNQSSKGVTRYILSICIVVAKRLGLPCLVVWSIPWKNHEFLLVFHLLASLDRFVQHLVM